LADVKAAYKEKIVTFGERGALVGVLSLPAVPRPGAPYVVLLNSGIIHRVGAHRSYVTFARALAASGVAVLRFDLSGIGDSERPAASTSLQDTVRRDIGAAVDHLSEKHGATRFILAGLCSGAFDAFEYTQSDPRVCGAFMLDMPGPFRNWSHLAYRAANRALRPASWANLARRISGRLRVGSRLAANGLGAGNGLVGPAGPLGPVGQNSDVPMFLPGVRGQKSHQRMEAELDQLLARGVRLVFLFTGGVDDDYNHRLQFRLRFPRAASHPAVITEFIPWSDHTFSTQSARDYVTEFLQNWVVQQLPERAP
jgi:pimeloyl-ACP methyl ester carboxylesterase